MLSNSTQEMREEFSVRRNGLGLGLGVECTVLPSRYSSISMMYDTSPLPAHISWLSGTSRNRLMSCPPAGKALKILINSN